MKIKYSFEQWCLDNNHQDYLDLWDYELNEKLPDEVGYSANKAYYFKCPRGIHSSETKYINTMTKNGNTIKCKQCNSLGQWMLDIYGPDAIDKLWSSKNDISPFQIAKRSSCDVWLKCINNVEHPDYLKKALIFSSGCECPRCSKRILIEGFNDVATTHPELLKYFLNTEDARRLSAGSNKKIGVICPDCGNITNKTVCDLTSNPFHCQRCGDGSSYPNKFVYEFLFQIQKKYNFEIYPEHVFEWSKCISDDGKHRRIYDFYIKYNDIDIIIEVHGNQHFNGSFCQYPNARTLEDEIQNDSYKKNLALNNGILASHYFVIDARKSNCNWISNSILHCGLTKVFDLDIMNVDWLRCNEVASKSLVKIVSSLWNNGECSASRIAQIIGKSKPTVIHYLKAANELGWCNYTLDDKDYFLEKPIMCTNNGIAFSSISLCACISKDVLGVNVSMRSLSRVLSQEKQSVRGLRFVYISRSDFASRKLEFPQLTYESSNVKK